MSDQHQVISIIATAIYDARKDQPHGGMDPEEAKQVAKCIIEALSGAGLRIAPVSDELKRRTGSRHLKDRSAGRVMQNKRSRSGGTWICLAETP
jgi:hypothetical protein